MATERGWTIVDFERMSASFAEAAVSPDSDPGHDPTT